MSLLTGIRSKDVARQSLVGTRGFSFYVYKPSPQTVVAGSDSETYNGAILYLNPGYGLEQMEFVALQASIHTVAAGITTFSIGIQKSGGVSLVEANATLKGHGKEVVYAYPTDAMKLAGTTRVGATEVCRILINSSNNENAFHLFVAALFRPLQGGEA